MKTPAREQITPIRPPASWRDPDQHYLTVLRHPWYRMICELNDVIATGTVDFWSARGARMLCLPITTGSISSPMGAGSDSAPVRVTLCGQETYLADSMQFMLEFGCRLAPGGCYYVMPSFRAERPDARHLSQFIHSEAEIAGGLEDVVEAVEEYIRHLSRDILTRLGSKLARAAGDVRHLEALCETQTLPRITFDEAARLLERETSAIIRSHEGWRGITDVGERRLLELFGEPLWLTHMDHLSVPFYQAFDGDRRRALNADLLLGIGETVGIGERHVGVTELDEALALHGVARDEYTWYREMKRRHPLRTAGFGMGVERFLLWCLRHDDIRDIPLLLRVNGENIMP